ncbi:hypothetical protein SAMN05444166_3608 [Singulisphaera sp. GP187]|nr:hypothetical protein SAMN05444166_3608 [Singulisphaera sp. GP187]
MELILVLFFRWQGDRRGPTVLITLESEAKQAPVVYPSQGPWGNRVDRHGLLENFAQFPEFSKKTQFFCSKIR